MGEICAYNEEKREMSLSLLTYFAISDSNKAKFKKLDENYSIMNYCHTLVKNFNQTFDTYHIASHEQNIEHLEQKMNIITNKMISIINKMSAYT